MKTLISLLLCFATLGYSAQLLEVKQGRTAIVKLAPTGNAPVIGELAAGTKVPMVGQAPRYYSIRLPDDTVAWSFKGNFLVTSEDVDVPLTADVLLARTNVLKIIILDVEKGDSTLIICPQENGERDVILIDAGESNDGGRIRQELINQGLSLSDRPVARFFATHYDGDHIGAISDVAPLCRIVYDHGPNNQKGYYADAMQDSNADRRPIALTYQETFSGGVNIDCVAVNRKTANNPSASPASDDNENSVALQISFQGFDYFTAGDLTRNVETNLIGIVRNCDVYHVNHHGSSTTSSHTNFIKAIDPEVSVASNGTQYGHPRAEVANNLITLVGSRFYQTNVNPDPDAHHPSDPKFIADTTSLSSSQENAEGARGNITIIVDPETKRYYVITPGPTIAESFPIEL